MKENKGQGVEAPCKRFTCLAIDDYPSVLDALSAILSPHYRIYRAENGFTALRLLGSHQIDVVLLDLKLPGLGGIEILRRIRELYPTLPVIIVTGHSRHRAVIDASNLVISGYLEKPFDNNELLEKVRSALSWVMINRAVGPLAWRGGTTLGVESGRPAGAERSPGLGSSTNSGSPRLTVGVKVLGTSKMRARSPM